MDERIQKYEEKMKKTLVSLEGELATIRAGRANPHILDKLTVDYYGAPTPLQQVANITVPEARMIQIQPWESSLIKGIEKAILTSDLGLNPSNDGKVIRLVFPELTEERRKELVKDVKKKGEGAKVAVRNIRRDAMDEAKKQEKDKEITGAMVALGGSIAVYGEKSDGSDWNVGIQDPNGKDGEVLGGIKVKSGTSISTSGDYEKTFTDKKTGKRYFHILDSKTGYSVKTDIRSCTIICNSGLNADGLSTACFSLGVKKSQKLLKKYNAKAVFVDKNNKVYVSDGVEFTLTAKDYKVLNL